MRQDTWRRCGARNTASRLAAGTVLRPGARSARPADSPEFLSQSASRRFRHHSACRSGLPAAPTRPCMKRFEAGCRSTPGRLPYVPGPSTVLGAPYGIAPPAAVYRRLAGSAPPAGPGCPHRAKIGPGSRAVSSLYPFLQMAGRCLGARRRPETGRLPHHENVWDQQRQAVRHVHESVGRVYRTLVYDQRQVAVHPQ